MAKRDGITLSRFIRLRQKEFVGATGDFTTLMLEIAHAAKIISAECRHAGLADMLGLTGHTNIQDEEVQKLDEFAQKTLERALDHTRLLAGFASEEEDDFIPLGKRSGDNKKFILNFDPLDGSSNIDTAGSIGTIIGIFRRKNEGDAQLSDFLRKGTEMVGAAYCIYGSSTLLVYSNGTEVHEFTLDPKIGEFYLSDENIRIPSKGGTYSVNEGYYHYWTPQQQRVVDYFKSIDKETKRPYKQRYIGSLVADFHRTLKQGGIFMYPKDSKSPAGKLRVLFECQPLAYICKAAGGSATDGQNDILDVLPSRLHERTSLYIGSPEDVATAHRLLGA